MSIILYGVPLIKNPASSSLPAGSIKPSRQLVSTPRAASIFQFDITQIQARAFNEEQAAFRAICVFSCVTWHIAEIDEVQSFVQTYLSRRLQR